MLNKMMELNQNAPKLLYIFLKVYKNKYIKKLQGPYLFHVSFISIVDCNAFQLKAGTQFD